MKTLRLAMAQMNPVVGDVENNVRAIKGWIREAKRAHADVVVFPELAVPGYPPEDLLLMPQFLREVHRAKSQLVKSSTGIMAVVGSVTESEDRTHPGSAGLPSQSPKPLNVAWVMANGRALGTYAKQRLPNYGVFDEERYFQPGTRSFVFGMGPIRLGITICEDLWVPDGPIRAQTKVGGAHIILNINASPYHVGKTRDRQQMLAARAKTHGVIVSYTNMVGGQDELVFDGNSLVFDASGQMMARAKPFQEDLLITDLELSPRILATSPSKKVPGEKKWRVSVTYQPLGWAPSKSPTLRPCRSRLTPEIEGLEEIYRALVLGVSDYVKKNAFSKVVIGISGGIDSALTAAIARDAIGPANVIGVLMPSPYTSVESRRDARALAKNLNISMQTIPITKVFRSFLRLLEPTFKGRSPDTTEENLQARIRGTLLMALSNKFGYLVLTTGNKSEMSVGYATLYGDMVGGFAVIKDVPKTRVFQLAEWRSRYEGPDWDRVTIPKNIQCRPPSAELKPDQLDQDSLPPYPVLDAILQAYVEENRSKSAILQEGFEEGIVSQVIGMVDRSEYKRRQAPIGIKISDRALGKDRRMPITNRFLLKG